MKIETVHSDKSLKLKAKVALIAEMLSKKELSTSDLIAFAERSGDVERGTGASRP
jgi:hypothetical protein